MKNFSLWLLAFLLMPVCSFAQTEAQMIQTAQADSTGWLGDDFSLEGALELFQKAKSPEHLEQWLNDENQHVNNLDLNEDGEVDYIKVVDQAFGKDHALVLQVSLNERESQDVAVIELYKLTVDSAIVQILGDESLYGSEIIIEPSIEFENEFKKVKGPALESLSIERKCINVWSWPCVQFIYRPIYQPWISPYYWRHYPPHWKPWKRYHWHRHWWYCHQQHHYGAYYWKSNAVRCGTLHSFYRNKRIHAHSIESRNPKGHHPSQGRRHGHYGGKEKDQTKKGGHLSPHSAGKGHSKGNNRKGHP